MSSTKAGRDQPGARGPAPIGVTAAAARASFGWTFALACVVVAFESALYAVITPLVPIFQAKLDLTAGGVGLLVAAYPIGMIVASLPGGWLASRCGPRAAVVVGLVLVAGGCGWFGLGQSLAMLQAARFVQGIGGAVCWCAALAWVAGAAPAGKQASAIGGVVGMTIVGVLLGPLVGGLAAELGQAVVFLAVSALGTALVVPVLLFAPATRSSMPVRGMLRALHVRSAAAATWAIGVTGVVIGATTVLVPLRLDGLGAGPTAVATVFVVGGVLEAIASPLAGMATDRRGPRRPLISALCVAAVLLVILGAVGARLAVMLVVVLLLPSVGILLTPSMAVLGRVGELRALPAAAAFTAGSLAWALGEGAGALGGPWLLQATGGAMPYLVLAVLCVGTAVALRRVASGL